MSGNVFIPLSYLTETVFEYSIPVEKFSLRMLRSWLYCFAALGRLKHADSNPL